MIVQFKYFILQCFGGGKKATKNDGVRLWPTCKLPVIIKIGHGDKTRHLTCRHMPHSVHVEVSLSSSLIHDSNYNCKTKQKDIGDSF